MDIFISNDLFEWVVIPILIFTSRIIDVSLGTLRIIFISRGKKYLAPLLGFFEVLIWLVVISNIMQNATNYLCYVAYAGGFAIGNYVGMIIEEKLALGTLAARVFIVEEKMDMLRNRLFEEGFGVTIVKGMGKVSETNILFCIFRRKELNKVVDIIEHTDSNMFYSIEEMKYVNRGIFVPRLTSKKL